jgi:hypothetical protein
MNPWSCKQTVLEECVILEMSVREFLKNEAFGSLASPLAVEMFISEKNSACNFQNEQNMAIFLHLTMS